MAQAQWNRSGRRGGGPRPTQLVLPALTPEEITILRQREQIRQEFGEHGVQRFDAALLAQTRRSGKETQT